MGQPISKSSSNSRSGDVESPGTLCNASRQSETSSRTLESSTGSRKPVDWNDSSSSSYDADDERGFDPDPEAGDSDQSDGSRSASPILNEHGVPFYFRVEDAEIEMKLYNIRRRKKYVEARMRRIERERMLLWQKTLLEWTRNGKPQPGCHPSNYVDMNLYCRGLAELTRPLTSPKLKAKDAPAQSKGRSRTLPSSTHPPTQSSLSRRAK